MAALSYASIASKPLTAPTAASVEKEVDYWLSLMSQVTQPPENMARLVELLRREMETPAGPVGFRGGANNHGKTIPPTNWRSGMTGSGNRFGQVLNEQRPGSAFDTREHGRSGRTSHSGQSGQNSPVTTPTSNSYSPRPGAGRYHSRFKNTGNIEDKILNTVIGNKLNSFTPLTYNDTRDFIYQIMDSGETEFTRDFIEKVFAKATLEDLYCALFAKLIAEIAHRYPVMYEEMNKYHHEFLKIFDNVEEDSEAEYTTLVKEKQYRMGYGQFIAELAGLNAVEKSQLVAMVTRIMDKIWILTAEVNKTKTVEEFIDCIIRLTSGLRKRSIKFFESVKEDLAGIIMERLKILTARSDSRPSLSNKARFGLMDLKDILI